MPEPQKQLIERIKQAQNVLVTVSRNPSIDQLAAAIGLTLALNHTGKHGTAVFSGQVPNTLEFLKPEETLEKNTDSLRDFIIALDKSKADKLRYKVEDNVVRIFITPYRTSISDRDLQFSQGDFNVEVVIALGVNNQQDLDEAITAHGRILHDATVATIGTHAGSELGTINWFDEQASSLSEMVVNFIDQLDKKVLDNQIATALLTGIVAATERFRNEKTSPKTMSASAALMAAGANQQLVASQLEAPASDAPIEGGDSGSDEAPVVEKAPQEPGMLEINHGSNSDEQKPDDSQQNDHASEPENNEGEPSFDGVNNDTNRDKKDNTSEGEKKPEDTESDFNPMMPIEPEEAEEKGPQVHVDADGKLVSDSSESKGTHELPKIGPVHGTSYAEPAPQPKVESEVPDIISDEGEGPKHDGMTANIEPEALDPSTERLTQPAINAPVLTHDVPVFDPAKAPDTSLPPMSAPASAPAPFTPPEPALTSLPATPAPTESVPPASFDTLEKLEVAVDSPHLAAKPEPTPDVSDVDSARDAVQAALSGMSQEDAHDPITALNAQPLGGAIHPGEVAPQPSPEPQTPIVSNPGFNEPSPGNTPADNTLDMPLPSFGGAPGTIPQNPLFPAAPAAAPTPPSAFPAAPQPGSTAPSPNSPPPVPPPPILPPIQ